jgi:hypothetical protein
VGSEADRLKREVERTQTALGETLGALGDRVDPTARAQDAAGRFGAAFSSAFGGDLGPLAEQARRAASATAAAIRRRPLASTGAALLVGWAAGRRGR